MEKKQKHSTLNVLDTILGIKASDEKNGSDDLEVAVIAAQFLTEIDGFPKEDAIKLANACVHMQSWSGDARFTGEDYADAIINNTFGLTPEIMLETVDIDDAMMRRDNLFISLAAYKRALYSDADESVFNQLKKNVVHNALEIAVHYDSCPKLKKQLGITTTEPDKTYTVEVTTVTTVEVTADSDEKALSLAYELAPKTDSYSMDAKIIHLDDGMPAGEKEHIRAIPVVPFKESLADRNCPVCGCGIAFDALNDDPKNIPLFCPNCGQALDWSVEFPDAYHELLENAPILKKPLHEALRIVAKQVGVNIGNIDTEIASLDAALASGEGEFSEGERLTMEQHLSFLEMLRKLDERDI